jgi:hypothetical protein
VTPKFARVVALLAAALLLAAGAPDPQGLPPRPPDQQPLPDPDKATPEDVPSTEPDAPEAEEPAVDLPWEIPPELRARLAKQAEVYRDYALRFVCNESARVAHYDESNEASRESQKRYSYMLERNEDGTVLHEYRESQKSRAKTATKESTGKAVDDEEKFPPAYAWVFLFSQENQPYFMYRSVGERFEGFDWVHEIQFRGASPFTDGRDIRQWEGTVLVDAVRGSPVEIRAEPSSQKERIRALFDQWSRAFNLVGARLAPRPFGYRCRVTFGLRRDKLAFPTELRYDTFRAVGARKFIPWMASVRVYDDYKFFSTSTTETPGQPVSK